MLRGNFAISCLFVLPGGFFILNDQGTLRLLVKDDAGLQRMKNLA